MHKIAGALKGGAPATGYGMTETLMNISNPYVGERRPGTVGFPLPGVSARIVGDELHLKGPNVFAGYWNMLEKTAAEFRPDGFFITGDLGKIDERGYVDLVSNRFAKEEEIMTLELALFDRQIAIQTLVGDGLPTADLPPEQAGTVR